MTAVITGGSSGIGLAAVSLFRQRGWTVYSLSRREGCDVTDAEACRIAIGQIAETEGRIDLLICCAGMGIAGPIELTSDHDAHSQMEVNVHGAINAVQAVLPFMRRQGSGRILFVSSVAAQFGLPYQSWYSASKAALNALALALRCEVRDQGIKVAVVMPGDVSTPFTAARQKAGLSPLYPHAAQSIATMEHDERHGMSPDSVASVLWRLATCRYVPMCTIVGWKYRLLCLLDRLVPKTLSTWVVGRMY